MTTTDAGKLAAEIRPPRMLVTQTIAIITLALSIVTGVTVYQTRGDQAATEKRTKVNTSIICGAARLRQTIRPQTPLEAALREYLAPTDAKCVNAQQP